MNLKPTRFVALAAVAATTTAGAAWAATQATKSPARATSASVRPVRVEPTDPLVAATERARRRTGRVDNVTLLAAPTKLHLGGRTVTTWAFNGKVPGPMIRVRTGDVLRARVVNRLSAPLTVHWHGIALRNDMDGVPGRTQKAIEPGQTSSYQFTVTQPGTFFYHSHVGTQLDRGLYGPLIVDPTTGRAGQRDITLLLDDWLDGTGKTPDQQLYELEHGMGAMGSGSAGGSMGMRMPTTSSPLGSDVEDFAYPDYLINGRVAGNPQTFAVKPGQRVRLRLINAASTTPFRVAFDGGRMTVVATDGYPVKPLTVDTLLIGMGERYDVLVTVPKPGVFPVVARVEGKTAQALAVLRSGPGANPMPDVDPMALTGKLLTYGQLHATAADALPAGRPDRTYTIALAGDMMSYGWRIDAPKTDGSTLPVQLGQRIRLVIANRSMMWHPIHLHGHTFQLDTGRQPGPRKDTVIVPPMGHVTVDFIAENPGQWMLHCHNIYHAEAGMDTVLSYVR
jgi:FtsP/CotA-like multicopper oxidase with cupredoxin domain